MTDIITKADYDTLWNAIVLVNTANTPNNRPVQRALFSVNYTDILPTDVIEIESQFIVTIRSDNPKPVTAQQLADFAQMMTNINANISTAESYQLFSNVVKASQSAIPHVGVSARIYAVPSDPSLYPAGTLINHIAPDQGLDDTLLNGGEPDGFSENLLPLENHKTVTVKSRFTGLTGNYHFNTCAWGLDSSLAGLTQSWVNIKPANGYSAAKLIRG